MPVWLCSLLGIKQRKPRAFLLLPQGSPTVEHFSAVARQLTSLVGVLLPFPSNLPSVYSVAFPACHCTALIIFSHLVFGLYLSGIAVYILERQSRAQFLIERIRAGQARQQLGLSAQEGLEFCTFDTLNAWLASITLLPYLVVLAWLAAMALSVRLAPALPGLHCFA
jgi:hypothetical protein